MALCYGSLTTLLICLVFSAVALGRVEPRYGLYALLAFSFFYLGYWGLLQVPASKFAAFTAAMFLWFARFSISIAVGLFALLTLTPSTVNSALWRMRLPGWATIPPVVFLRVLPIITTEARAIKDVMKLRGLQPGLKSWFTKPTQSSAMLVIPLLGAVVRAGDELASSALVRGLGRAAYPTTTIPLQSKVVDAVTLIILALVIASVWIPTEWWG